MQQTQTTDGLSSRCNTITYNLAESWWIFQCLWLIKPQFNAKRAVHWNWRIPDTSLMACTEGITKTINAAVFYLYFKKVG